VEVEIEFTGPRANGVVNPSVGVKIAVKWLCGGSLMFMTYR
jgi:hypothetical protein